MLNLPETSCKMSGWYFGRISGMSNDNQFLRSQKSENNLNILDKIFFFA